MSPNTSPQSTIVRLSNEKKFIDRWGAARHARTVVRFEQAAKEVSLDQGLLHTEVRDCFGSWLMELTIGFSRLDL